MKKKNTKNNDIEKYSSISYFSFFVGLFLLSFVFFNILFSSTLFIFKVSITKYAFYLALLASFSLNYFINNKQKPLLKLLSIILPLFIIGLSIFLNGKIYDYTWDGNSYHKSTIGMMISGWNPLYERMEDFDKNNNNPINVADNSYIWGNHYAKASHIYAANIGAVTHNIESGKSINTISIIMFFCFSFSILLYSLKKVIRSLTLSLCFITCTTICSQFLTNYVDLLVYIYFFLIILLFFAFDYFKLFGKKNDLLLIVYFMALVIAINIKFSLFAYAGLYCLGYYIWYLLRLKKKQIDKKFFIKFTIDSILAVFVAVFFVGLSVYPKNFIKNGNPFYPLMGDGKIDIMTVNSPDYFENKSAINKFIIATFSKADNISKASGLKASYKVPFSIYKSELAVQYSCDLRISGNGLLFSGILLMCLIIYAFNLKKIYKNDNNLFYLMIIPTILTIVLVFTLGESWWARYFPELHLIIFFALLSLFIYTNKKLCIIFFYIIVILLFINNSIVFVETVHNAIDYTQTVAHQFAVLEGNTNPETCKLSLYTNSFHGALYDILYREKDYKIVYSSAEEYEKNAGYYSGLMGSFVVWTCVE